MSAGRVHAHLAGEHHLLQLTRPDALDRPAHRLLVVRGGRGAGHPGTRHRVGIEQRRLGGTQRRQPPAYAIQYRLGRLVAVHRRVHGHARLIGPAHQGHLRQYELGRREALPLRRAAAGRGKGSPPQKIGPVAGGSPAVPSAKERMPSSRHA